MIIDPNNKNGSGIIMPPGTQKAVTGEAVPQAAKKPEDYIYEANAKAQARTGFVGRMAEQLFHAVWKDLDRDELDNIKEIAPIMDNCFTLAELWRQKLNKYQHDQAEAIHNAEVDRWAASKIHLPTWGEVKDHFPGAAGMFGGN